MASPTNDPFHQSAIEKFNDAFKNQAAANRNDGYFKTPDRTPPPVSEPPPPTSSLAERAQLHGTFYNPAANGNDGYFKTPNRTPQPPPSFEPPKPQKVSDSFYQRELRNQQGLTQGRALNDNPGFRNPNPTSLADKMGIPTSASGSSGLSGLAPLLKGSGPGFGIGLGLTILPGVLQQGPKYFDPSNPNGIFAPTPEYREYQRTQPQRDALARKQVANALKNMGLPPWLNPFKDTSKTGESASKNSDKPNAESKKRFDVYHKLRFYENAGSGGYKEVDALSYRIVAFPKHLYPSTPPIMTARLIDDTYLREGTDAYAIYYKIWVYADSFTTFKIIEAGARMEPWTLEDLGIEPIPSPGGPNPEPPENLIPETNKPFLPPHVPDFHGYDTASPPTILDPNDFRSPSNKPPLSPMFPPTLPPVPKPLDPIQNPEPTNPKEQKPAPIVPTLPFNPFRTPPTPNPVQSPPTFEPTPQNPNQRLNDRGIFPARKADITASASGSPLSPDVQIGGDPVRLVTPAPKITKPPFETQPSNQPKPIPIPDNPLLPLAPLVVLPFLPFVPPVFPKPVNPTGTIDPNTADDITRSKVPPVPPTGTAPKCQDGCMAGLQSGQQSILDKLNGGGINTALSAGDALLLNTINEKLGIQVPGGISGFLQGFKEGFEKLSDWLHLDRVLNILTLTLTLQNAYFLCDSLKIVTLQMISDALSVIGIKNKEGDALNINQILDKSIEDILKQVLGVQELEGIKKEWKALSRIYQAGSNIINSVQSMAWSVLNALNIIGSANAQIGNALKKYKVLGERAFAWMNPSPNFHNKFFTATFNALNIVSNIDFVAQSVISARQSVDQIEQQSGEFQTDFTEATHPTPSEHKPTKAAETKAKTDSVGLAASEADLKNYN
jgi:hypothetical protein